MNSAKPGLRAGVFDTADESTTEDEMKENLEEGGSAR